MIAIDAMGGDHAPQAPTIGALHAARRGIAVTLFGDESQLIPILDREYSSWRTLPLSLVHCTESISMFDQPSKAIMRKKDSSLLKAVQAVADGKADAIVSAGNSGAVLVAGSVILGRVGGVLRPAIGQFLPTKKDSIFCLDLGANADCKPEYLKQFAIIGSTYVQLKKNIESPRVALLSNGAEPYKGSTLVKEAYALLEKTSGINFVGNLEPRDMFDDYADVLVCDGFSGNVMLKSIQGTTKTILHWIEQKRTSSLLRRVLFLFVCPLLKKLRMKVDYARKGGALLLGVQKPMVLAHGSSSELAMKSAIEFAYATVEKKVVEQFNEALASRINKRVRGAFRMAQKVKEIFRSSRS